MIILANSTDQIRIVSSAAIPIHVHMSYMDLVQGATTPNRTDFTTSSAGSHSVLSGPAAGYRAVHSVSITNADPTVASDIEVIFWDGSTATRLKKLQVPALGKFAYVDGDGWKTSQRGIAR